MSSSSQIALAVRVMRQSTLSRTSPGDVPHPHAGVLPVATDTTVASALQLAVFWLPVFTGWFWGVGSTGDVPGPVPVSPAC
jgi:hypothetical protein